MASDVAWNPSLWLSAGGVVPPDWKLMPFGELLQSPKSIAVGVMYPGEQTNGGVPLIRVGDVGSGGVVERPSMSISAGVHHEYRRTELTGDELLITLVGTPGVCVVARPEMKGWNVARALAVARLKRPELRPYIKAVMESAVMRNIITSMLNTTVQPTLNLKEIKALPLPMPRDVGTARELGVFAELFNQRIALLRTTNATLEAIAQALFKSWFVDFDPVRAKDEGREPEGIDAATAALFPSEFEKSELGLIPTGWHALTFGELIENSVGGDWGKELADATHDSEVAIIRGTDLPDLRTCASSRVPQRFTTRKKLESRKLIEGDLVVEVSGGSKDQPTGRSLFVTKELLRRFDTPVVPASFCRRFRPASKQIGHLLAQHMDYIYRIGRTWDYQNQSTGIANFQTTHFLKSELLTVPPEHVLLEFGRLVGPIVERTQLREINCLADLRDTLLPRLISGKLRLADAEDLVKDAGE